MVREKKTYVCEFPGCNGDYPSRSKAKECQNQGVIGPDIRGGFTLGYFNGYMIIRISTALEGHEKIYSFMQISDSLDAISLTEKGAKKNNEDSARNNQIGYRYNDYKISMLETLIQSGDIRLLEASEFRKFNRFFREGKSFENIRNDLETDGIERLYRTHPYFK